MMLVINCFISFFFPQSSSDSWNTYSIYLKAKAIQYNTLCTKTVSDLFFRERSCLTTQDQNPS